MQRRIEVRPPIRMRFFRGPRVLFGVLCLTASLFLAAAEARAQSEDQIKAAFLFNFARYVEWPGAAFGDPGSPIRICLMGAEDFSTVVTLTVSGKSVGARPVEIKQPDDVRQAAGCHILYVGEDSRVAAANLASQLASGSVFTVSDRDGFAKDGGIANFFRADNKVRFEINVSAAKRAGLKVSSQLLRLAKVVE